MLRDRLVTLDWDPPARRYGRVFVGTPHQARGRAFRVVFVPGLAERIVPQRPREDPLLLDERRAAHRRRSSPRQDDRGSAERLLLKIAIGAATERLYLSYPRMDVAETRARVPSFYALDVMRAITGRVPDHRVLAAEAAEEGGATLAWPAPPDPDRAIDDLEHDLAVLKPLLDSRDPASVKGRAHYMLGLNEALRRSVISRWCARPRRSGRRATASIKRGTGDRARARRATGSARAPYSLSALQRFATCPYQFLLVDDPPPRAVGRAGAADAHGSADARQPVPPGAGGVLSRAASGRARCRSRRDAVRRRGPARSTRRSSARPRIQGEARAGHRARVARRNRRARAATSASGCSKLADERDWMPEYFEFSFGLSDEGRDPAQPAASRSPVDGRFLLRGSVDLIEEHAQLGVLRVTDHKTGKNRSNPDLVVGGGATLQPVLYSVAVEEGLGRPVVEGRLFYCTTAGGFGEHPIPINDYTRGQGLEVLDDRRPRGRAGLPRGGAGRATPARWCDFRPSAGRAKTSASRARASRTLDDLARVEGDAMTPRHAIAADRAARDAIATDLDDTLVVEAAAGTGKTTELVEPHPARARHRPRDDAARSSPSPSPRKRPAS